MATNDFVSLVWGFGMHTHYLCRGHILWLKVNREQVSAQISKLSRRAAEKDNLAKKIKKSIELVAVRSKTAGWRDKPPKRFWPHHRAVVLYFL